MIFCTTVSSLKFAHPTLTIILSIHLEGLTETVQYFSYESQSLLNSLVPKYNLNALYSSTCLVEIERRIEAHEHTYKRYSIIPILRFSVYDYLIWDLRFSQQWRTSSTWFNVSQFMIFPYLVFHFYDPCPIISMLNFLHLRL
jgi:hypothetical protein